MPTPLEILSGLATIANDAIVVAILWHALLAIALLAAALGSPPSRRDTASAIALLPASVATVALVYGNPVNGIVFAATAVALAVLGNRKPPSWTAPGWARGLGYALLAYGWVYPHFVIGPPIVYLVASPVGLVPCPSLAVAIGLALVSGAGDRAWRWTLGTVATAYALFGVLRLGVLLDLGLLVGALAICASTFEGRVPRTVSAAAGSHA
jgi:hypothetical protein